MKRLILISALALVFSGCATVVYESPPNKELYIGPSSASYSKQMKGKTWFILYSLYPLTPNTTSKLGDGLFNMNKNNPMLGMCNDGGKVHFKTYMGPIDIVLSWAVDVVISSIVPGLGSILSPDIYTTEVYCE